VTRATTATSPGLGEQPITQQAPRARQDFLNQPQDPALGVSGLWRGPACPPGWPRPRRPSTGSYAPCGLPPGTPPGHPRQRALRCAHRATDPAHYVHCY